MTEIDQVSIDVDEDNTNELNKLYKTLCSESVTYQDIKDNLHLVFGNLTKYQWEEDVKPLLLKWLKEQQQIHLKMLEIINHND